METLFVCLKLKYSIIKKKKNQNCIKYRLSQFLFLQHKMYYVALVAIFIIFIYHCIMLLLFVIANVIRHVKARSLIQLSGYLEQYPLAVC